MIYNNQFCHKKIIITQMKSLLNSLMSTLIAVGFILILDYVVPETLYKKLLISIAVTLCVMLFGAQFLITFFVYTSKLIYLLISNIRGYKWKKNMC